jgi:hypothetical protein
MTTAREGGGGSGVGGVGGGGGGGGGDAGAGSRGCVCMHYARSSTEELSAIGCRLALPQEQEEEGGRRKEYSKEYSQCP